MAMHIWLARTASGTSSKEGEIMTALEAYILARAYTSQAIAGAGALKGAPCQIQSITPITGGNRITFAWETSEGETETDTLDVMDGVNGTNGTDGTDGTDGVGISSITFKEKDASGNNVYTVTLTNTNTYDITCPIGPQGETGATGATGATGNGIASITKTGTEGLVDTYTITYTNGQTTTFTVTNGQTPTVDSAMSDSSANPVENRVIDAQLKTKANQAQLATVEASTTASKAYSANEYLVLGGVLYKVTANIAQGGTIVTEGAGKNVDLATVGEELSALKSGLINVNTINNQCSFDVNSIRATFNAQSKVVSFDVRSNDGFTASTWTALLTITDATLAPSVAMYFPVVFINANRDDVVGHGVGKLDTSNIISVCPDDTIPAYSEAVGLVMWQ